MTSQKTFKRRVRSRMEKTGESYVTARRHLLEGGKHEVRDQAAADYRAPISDEAIRGSTGRDWSEWFAVLDAWEGHQREHRDIAAWLGREHGVDSWWAQGITVAYEQARGKRAPGQRADGTFAASASKTVAVSVERLFDAFADERLRERWLSGSELRVRTARRARSLRADWDDGATRVNINFTATRTGKSQAALQHERLPDADSAEEMKAWWRERMATLKRMLEEGEPGAGESGADGR